jgi:hypothetical protein
VLALYQEAAAAYGLLWPLLAGVGMAETSHGRLTATSSAGAQGRMQFLPATFAAYGIDGDLDGRIDIRNDADSIHSAAHHLAALGATDGGDGVRTALYGYNRATWYVNDVLAYAAHYATKPAPPTTPPCPMVPRAPAHPRAAQPNEASNPPPCECCAASKRRSHGSPAWAAWGTDPTPPTTPLAAPSSS